MPSEIKRRGAKATKLFKETLEPERFTSNAVINIGYHQNNLASLRLQEDAGFFKLGFNFKDSGEGATATTDYQVKISDFLPVSRKNQGGENFLR